MAIVAIIVIGSITVMLYGIRKHRIKLIYASLGVLVSTGILLCIYQYFYMKNPY